MELFILLLPLVWLVGFVATGLCYFAPRLIKPSDQHWIPGLVAIFWPVGLPVYHIVTRLRTKGRTQEDRHNPWLD